MQNGVVVRDGYEERRRTRVSEIMRCRSTPAGGKKQAALYSAQFSKVSATLIDTRHSVQVAFP